MCFNQIGEGSNAVRVVRVVDTCGGEMQRQLGSVAP